MNTQEIKEFVSTSIPVSDDVITLIGNFCIVNLDYLTNRDYQSQGVNELLFLLGQHRGKTFIFLCCDGVNLQLTGLSNVVSNLIDNLGLDQENCYIYGYQNPNIPNTTFVELDVVEMWCNQVFEEITFLKLSSNNFSKKFAAMYGRHDLYRLKFCKHLFEKHQFDSLLSYNSHIGQWNHRFEEKFFHDDYIWYKENCPLFLDFETSRGWVPFQESLQLIGERYQTYFIEIVCETDPHSNKFFTEKTLKNFYLGKPFLLFSGYQSLAYLQSRGFKTFAPLIDESYDQIKCPYGRFSAIVKEIDRLASLSYQNLNHMAQQMQPIFEHNRQNFAKFLYGRNVAKFV
jgi:hypothetical protein